MAKGTNAKAYVDMLLKFYQVDRPKSTSSKQIILAEVLGSLPQCLKVEIAYCTKIAT